jgi:hypothetical protein
MNRYGIKEFNPTDRELWSLLHPWIKYIALNREGNWIGFEDKPILFSTTWKNPYCKFKLDCLMIDRSVNWRESLTERPK